MPSHYSDSDRHIWSVPTPTGSQLLPACGMAWGIQLDGKTNLVVTTVGDAATRQGDFYEAVCFAKERKLPVLFVVEDNAYGISSPTRKINPLALDVLQPNDWQQSTDTTSQQVYDAAAKRSKRCAPEKGPSFFWVRWNVSPATPARTTISFIAARKSWRAWKMRSAQMLERAVDRGRSDHRGGIRQAGQRNQRANPAGIQRRGKSGRSFAERGRSQGARKPAGARRRNFAAGQISNRRHRQQDAARRTRRKIRTGSFSAKTSKIRRAACFV